MGRDNEKLLSPAEVEIVLRRAAELNARRRSDDPDAVHVSPEVLVQVAGAAGIPEGVMRRALWDFASEKTAEPRTFSRKFYGPARLRAVREIERPLEQTRENLEGMLRAEQGLKLRRKTEVSSLWDAGDAVGAVRRALDFSGERTLLKARSVELRIEEVDEGRCATNLTADLSNQRGEHLSLAGVLGATIALLPAIAAVQTPVYFLAVLPALVAPAFGFKLAYRRACTEIRRTLDELLDAAEEEGPPADDEGVVEQDDRSPGQIRGLKPIPKFAPRWEED